MTRARRGIAATAAAAALVAEAKAKYRAEHNL